MKIDFLSRYEKFIENCALVNKKKNEVKKKKNSAKWKKYYNENKEKLNKEKQEYHKKNRDAYNESRRKWYENLKKNPIKYNEFIQRISENRRKRMKMEKQK